jgi:hypothetical protein
MKLLQIGSVLAATTLMTIFPVRKSTGVAAEVEINQQTLQVSRAINRV